MMVTAVACGVRAGVPATAVTGTVLLGKTTIGSAGRVTGCKVDWATGSGVGRAPLVRLSNWARSKASTTVKATATASNKLTGK